MSNAPHVIPLRSGTKFGDATLRDTIQRDGLTDAMCHSTMGVTAENVAKRFVVSRAEQDAYAAESQKRTAEAQRTGFFDSEIVAVSVPGGRGAVTVVAKDEFPRNETTAESLAKLRPCFIRVRRSLSAYELINLCANSSFNSCFVGRIGNGYPRQCIRHERFGGRRSPVVRSGGDQAQY